MPAEAGQLNQLPQRRLMRSGRLISAALKQSSPANHNRVVSSISTFLETPRRAK
jgi:hypothetical protein